LGSEPGPLVDRPLWVDLHDLAANYTSGGVAIADHTVFLATTAGPGAFLNPVMGSVTHPQAGYVIAYQL
jgi:hypothetical protein